MPTFHRPPIRSEAKPSKAAKPSDSSQAQFVNRSQLTPQTILHLQQHVGNQTVMRMMAAPPTTDADRLAHELYDSMTGDDGGHIAASPSDLPNLAQTYQDKPIHTVVEDHDVRQMSVDLAHEIMNTHWVIFNNAQQQNGYKVINQGGGNAQHPLLRANWSGDPAADCHLIRNGQIDNPSPLVATSIQSIQMTITRTVHQNGSVTLDFQIQRLHWMPHHT